MKKDTEIFDLIAAEEHRQWHQINMIASENIASLEVRKAVGSALMHKYSEGNIGKRYYQGNPVIDEIEGVAIERAKKLFKLPADWGVNVQALSGSNANVAAITAVVEPGETIMSMYLADGGHLSHGWSYDPEVNENETKVHLQGSKKVHIIAKLFNIVQYKTDPQTQLFDYDEVAKIAQEHKPKLLITGGTAYPRNIDHGRMAEIAKSAGALYMTDIAHEAGLVAAGLIENPVGIADIVTMTTHKTLRAARGAIILAKEEIIKKVNRALLPGLQGGPFNNNIAGIAVGLGEALQPAFHDYSKAIIENRQAFEDELKQHGFTLVAGGGDKHLLLIDLRPQDIDGKTAAEKLAEAGIIANMNSIPWDGAPPTRPSGLRLGTPMLTTQGADAEDMRQIAGAIAEVLKEEKPIEEVKSKVAEIMARLRLRKGSEYGVE